MHLNTFTIQLLHRSGIQIDFTIILQKIHIIPLSLMRPYIYLVPYCLYISSYSYIKLYIHSKSLHNIKSIVVLSSIKLNKIYKLVYPLRDKGFQLRWKQNTRNCAQCIQIQGINFLFFYDNGNFTGPCRPLRISTTYTCYIHSIYYTNSHTCTHTMEQISFRLL